MRNLYVLPRSLQFEGMDEAAVDEHAKRAAEYFWWTSREDPASVKLVKEDLQPYLGSEAEVEYMFQLFDQNGDGFVVFEEVQQQFVNLYRCAPLCYRVSRPVAVSTHCPASLPWSSLPMITAMACIAHQQPRSSKQRLAQYALLDLAASRHAGSDGMWQARCMTQTRS